MGTPAAHRHKGLAAAHRILSNSFGLIPFGLYRKEGEERVAGDTPELIRVLKIRPNDYMSPFVLRKVVMSNAFWHGFGAVWNRRGPDGLIAERIPLPSDCCSIRQDPETGQYFYDYSVDGVFRTFTGYELSFLFFESYDGIRGRGFLNLARETIGAEGAAQQYGRKFYQNGAMISGIVEVDTDLGREERDRVRSEFAKYNPYDDDAFKVAVLGRGYKYTPIGLNQKDSQYIESRTFSVEEVARFSGVPKSMLQSGKESYESNQQQRIVFVTDVLMPYIIQAEQENSYKCLLRQQRAEGLYFKGNPAVLLRGDDAPILEEDGGRYRNCPAFPFDGERGFETYRIVMLPGGALEAQPHLPGTEEYVTVFAGEAEIGLPGETYRLRTGDSLRFPADQPHRYRNPGTEETQLSMLIWYRH